MAKIQLEVEVEGLAKVREFGTTVASATKIIKDGTVSQKKAFQDNAKAITETNKLLVNNKAALRETLSPIQQLKKEIKELEAAALKAGEGTETFTKAIQEAGKKKADLKDLKEAINALDPDRVAAGFLSLGRSVAGGFAVAQSATALLGENNENLERTIIKLQAAQAALSGLQELANAKDELAKVRIIALQKLQTLEVKKGIVATEGATIAQRLWNVAASGFPLAALIAGLTVIAGLVAAYVSDSRNAAEADEVRARAIDGTIIKNVELRKAYNEHITVLKDLQIEYKVLTGEIGELEGALEKIKNQHSLAVSEINNEAEAKIKETESIWNRFKNTLLSGGSTFRAEILRQQQIAEIQKERADKITQEQQKSNEKQEEELLRSMAKRIQLLKTLGKTEIEARIIAIREEARERIKTEDDLLKARKITLAEHAKEVRLIQEDAEKQISKVLAEEAKRRNEDRLKREGEYQEALKDLLSKSITAQLEMLAPKERLDKEKELAEQALENQKAALIEKGKAVKADFKLTQEQEEAFAQIKLAINQKYYNGLFDLQKAEAERQRAYEEKVFNLSIKDLEERQEIQVNELQAMENLAGTPEEKAAFERERQKAILAVQIEYAEKRLALLAASGDAENQAAISRVKATITDLKKEQEDLNKVGEAGSTAGNLIMKAFKVSPEDADAIVANAQLLAGQLKSVLSETADESIAQNQRLISSLNSRISETQKALDQEIELNKRGFASNIENKKKEIAELQAQREAAIKAEAEAQKRKQRIEDAEQISAIITAAANVIKGWAQGVPLVGSILGMAAVATMIGGFIATKSQARAAVSGFKKGGYTGDIGVDQEAGVVHGQEFVMTADKTKKYRSQLQAMLMDKPVDITPFLSNMTYDEKRLQGIRVNVEALKNTTERNIAAGSGGLGVTSSQIKSIHQELTMFRKQYLRANSGLNSDIKSLPDGTVITKEGSKTTIVRKIKPS